MYYFVPLYGFGADEAIEENAAIPADDVVIEELIPEEQESTSDTPRQEAEEVVVEEITSDEWMISASLATQIFSIVPGVAGGIAGFILAAKLSNAKSVNATEVLKATGLVAAVTFLSVFLVKTVEEFD